MALGQWSAEGDSSTGIAYAGTPLEPAHRYLWSARVWDEAGQLGPWSANRYVHDGLEPSRSGWDGCWWIGLGRDRVAFEAPCGERPR